VRAQGARVFSMGWWVVDSSLEAIPRTLCLPWLCFLVVHSQVGTFFSPDVLGVFVGVASPNLQLMRISGQSLARPCVTTYVRAYARCTLGAFSPHAVKTSRSSATVAGVLVVPLLHNLLCQGKAVTYLGDCEVRKKGVDCIGCS
jgi:hypothetical protein